MGEDMRYLGRRGGAERMVMDGLEVVMQRPVRLVGGDGDGDARCRAEGDFAPTF